MRQARPTKERILEAAERLVAEHGFDGVSMRQIAAEAQAQLALLHYHFGSKEDLYRAVWESRYASHAGVRSDLLASFDFERPREAVLRELVEVFVRPPMTMSVDPAMRDFVRVMAREGSDPKEGQRGVLAEFVDPSALLLLRAFRRALPELSDPDIAWGYQFMAGIVMAHMADASRISRLSGGAARSGDAMAALPRMVEFIYGGWMQLVAARGVPNAQALSPRKLKARRRRIGKPKARRRKAAPTT